MSRAFSIRVTPVAGGVDLRWIARDATSVEEAHLLWLGDPCDPKGDLHQVVLTGFGLLDAPERKGDTPGQDAARGVDPAAFFQRRRKLTQRSLLDADPENVS